MKKVALLLGSLLMVGAVAQAADAATTFKPTGYVDLQYRIHGKTENAGNSTGDWNAGHNDVSRLQILGNISITENQSLEYRIRNYNSISKDGKNSDGDETRLRYFYNHGNLDNTNIDFVSRVQYKREAGSDQSLEYMPRFSFAKYMPEAVSKFVIAPRYSYKWNDKNNNDYINTLGLDLETYTNLPFGFGFEFNIENSENFYGTTLTEKTLNKTNKKQNYTVGIKAVLDRDFTLYTMENTNVIFHFEGGLDKYHLSQYRQYGDSKTCHGKYSLYTEPSVQVNYTLNNSTELYAAIGAEYRNFDNKSDKSASTWRWQPEAWAGFKTTF